MAGPTRPDARSGGFLGWNRWQQAAAVTAAAVMLAALAALVGLVVDRSRPVLGTSAELESAVEQELQARGERPLEAVECEEEDRVRSGDVLDCTLRFADGQKAAVSVEPEGDSFDDRLRIRVPS